MQELVTKMEIEYIVDFQNDQQVEGYRILKNSEFNTIHEKHRHEEKKYLIEKLTKLGLKIVSITSAIFGALAVVVEQFLPV